MLIRRAQEAFDHEYLMLLRRRREATELAQRAREAELGCRDRLARADREVAAQSVPLTSEQLNARRPGEERHGETLVRLRRRREQRRLRAVALTGAQAAQRELVAARERLAAAIEAEERHLDAARVRVRRIHEHTHRRLATYRRRLVRSHPQSEWVNSVLGVLDPSVPGWALPILLNGETVPGQMPARPLPPDDPIEEEQPSPTLIPLQASSITFGSATPPSDVRVTGYGVAARHFTLTREPEGVRLRDHGHGHGPYVDGRPVRSVLLRPGEHFDFVDRRYRITDDGAAVAVTALGRCRLVVHDLSSPGRLAHMSFVQREGTLVAIIGPSGAGKSSLFKALLGEIDVARSAGSLYFRGLDLRQYAEQIRTMLGYVPQDDAMYHTLTVRGLLRYADRLRSAVAAHHGDRDRRIERICAGLDLTGHLDRLVSTLSGGQRKRVSIAMEMLSEPDLLMLDEPTSGLDAHRDREVMRSLRDYAAGGRTVIVITHAPEHLHLADLVLVLARDGLPIYYGPPRSERRALGVGSYADLMQLLAGPAAEPLAAAYQQGQAVGEASREAADAAAALPDTARAIRRPWPGLAAARQLPVLIHRQFVLIRSQGLTRNRGEATRRDRLRAVLVAAAPLVIAAVGAWLAALVTGADGLGVPTGDKEPGLTAISLLTTLSMLNGQALTYSNLVTEYEIIRREHRTGLSVPALLTAKFLVFAAIAMLQAALVTVVFLQFRPGPAHQLAATGGVELFAGLAALTMASMTLGLLISAVARRSEQAVALTTVAAIAQITLNGITSDMSGNRLLSSLAVVLPDRWGLAAVAASSDLRSIARLTAPHDELWRHTSGQWLFDLAVLGLLTVACFAAAVTVLRRRLRRPS
ncbi:ATP-binding cassette domain-containing protein [Dactylosporangium vinaceum]|uniref:ATP-binding cassette domain-containing protein n=1 Tax=Dactylosporangium vinaceum TaxID=53362 RepID=UPI001CA911D3|nr:ATP-binding cassette domain-containing protein [Dactylosporangium vinaceum]UAB97402.1 ATP-binding cassette domain-containing protein [Dactylosporangium vinaceum]